MTRMLKLHRMGNDSKSKKCHKSGKVHPTEDSKVLSVAGAREELATIPTQKKKASNKRKKPPVCGRCGELGHPKNECTQPDFGNSKKGKQRCRYKYTTEELFL